MSDEDETTDVEAIRIDVQIFHEHERIDEARKIDRRRCVARMHDGRCAPVEDSLMTYEGEDEDGIWEQPICFALPGGVTADWMPVVLK